MSASGTLGTGEDSVASVVGILRTRENSPFISAAGTLGTRKGSAVSTCDTLRTREDSSHFNFWYPGGSGRPGGSSG